MYSSHAYVVAIVHRITRRCIIVDLCFSSIVYTSKHEVVSLLCAAVECNIFFVALKRSSDLPRTFIAQMWQILNL